MTEDALWKTDIFFLPTVNVYVDCFVFWALLMYLRICINYILSSTMLWYVPNINYTKHTTNTFACLLYLKGNTIFTILKYSEDLVTTFSSECINKFVLPVGTFGKMMIEINNDNLTSILLMVKYFNTLEIDEKRTSL